MTKDNIGQLVKFSCAKCGIELSRFDDKYNDGYCDNCYDERKQFNYKLGKDHTIQFTPKRVVLDIIKQIPILKTDTVLEPFYGEGEFFNNFPECKKYYCEIKNGLDFFDWNVKVDWIISNPPFRIFQGDKKLNGFPLIMDKSVELAEKGIVYLISWKLWNSLTIPRLVKWQPFNLSKIRIYQIKEWFGRYYMVVFEKKKPIIEWSEIK